MRKIIASEMMTLDGKFGTPDESYDWHVVNEEFFEVSNRLITQIDAIIYGRITYQGMESYWTTPEAAEADPFTTEGMNKLHKIVFSKTLDKVTWQNSTLIKGDLVEEVKKLKQQPGKDIAIYGSGSIVSALTEAGLIDEYYIFLVPSVMGKGKPLFSGMAGLQKLKLIDSKTFNTGVVMLTYQPASE